MSDPERARNRCSECGSPDGLSCVPGCGLGDPVESVARWVVRRADGVEQIVPVEVTMAGAARVRVGLDLWVSVDRLDAEYFAVVDAAVDLGWRNWRRASA